MKETPILFSGPMVNAILEGRKTQTRRVARFRLGQDEAATELADGRIAATVRCCPYGVPGARLWCREAWGVASEYDDRPPSEIRAAGRKRIWYRADGSRPEWVSRTRSPIHMPRWACRLVLEITEVRVERLTSISEEDARAEGAVFHNRGGLGVSGWQHDNAGYVWGTARESFRDLWQSINGKRPGCGWGDDPWVWCLTFRRVSE